MSFPRGRAHKILPCSRRTQATVSVNPVLASSSGARIRHASVTSSLRRSTSTSASRSITSGQPSYPGAVKKVSGSPRSRACFSASSPTNSTAMSVRITRGLPGLRSGYDQTNPLPPTLKSKPSLSISSTSGRASARRRTSSASAIEVSPGSRHQHAQRLGEPRVPLGVFARVVGVEVDEAALDLPVADLEDVAPSAGTPLGDPGPPGAVTVLAVAGALAYHHVGREHPVEVGVMVDDQGDRAADVGEQLADGLLAGRESPLGEVDLRVVGEQIQDAAAVRGDTTVVEGLQVLQR